MKRLAITLALVPSVAMAGNYGTCLLKHLPGLQNDAAAQAAINLCMREYPGGFNTVRQGEGRGFMSFNSGAECALKKGGSTASQLAGRAILVACNKLYDEPISLFDDLIPAR